MLGAVVFLTILAGIAASADISQASPETHDSRIVSGWEAQEGQFPYMLWLRTVRWTGQVTSCGGSIIHQRWGLTSARCTAQRIEIIVRAGSVNWRTPLETFAVENSFRPPSYDDSLMGITQPNDISLIRFSKELTFNSNIQPIRLQRSADMNRDYSNVVMTTSGWGSLRTCMELDCPVPDILNWVYLRGVSNFVCMLMFNSNFLVQDTTICAGPYNVTSQAVCAGDSGVPLITIDVDGQLSQIGVASFGSYFGCEIGFPDAFIRPGHFQGWMRQVTGINFDWNLSKAEEAVANEYDVESLMY